jgi:hypothetical protein
MTRSRKVYGTPSQDCKLTSPLYFGKHLADGQRGTSNSFGVPYEGQPGDPAPTEDELVDYGEDTWEVSTISQIIRLRKY